MKELDVILYPPLHEGDPGNEYILGRNNLIAHQSARLLGGTVCRLSESSSDSDKYYIPSKILKHPEARELAIRSEADLLGSVVEAELHSQKAIFHQLVAPAAESGEYYSEQFAQSIQDAVLPGFSAFSSEDAVTAMQHLHAWGYQVRLKDPTKNDSKGQYPVHDEAQLRICMAELTHDVAKSGVVLEADLLEPYELIVGQLFHGGGFYSYYGKKFEQTINGRSTYGGTVLTMTRGGFRTLLAGVEGGVHTAVSQAAAVYEAYSLYNPILSRVNFDILQGYSNGGSFLSGVIDQSLRVAGATPAELLAIEALINDPFLPYASAQSTVVLNPVDHMPMNGEEYFDYNGRRDVARLI